MVTKILDIKEIAQRIAEEAVEQIRINVDGEEMTLNEFGRMVRRYYAMPVVRCGMCKHQFIDGDNVRVARCELNHNDLMPDDWYCADGEVRDSNV